MTAQTLPAPRSLGRSGAQYNSNSDPQEPLYGISEAAKLLGVSPSTLRRWEDEGRLIPVRTSGGNHRRYSQSDVKRLLKSFRRETDSRRNNVEAASEVPEHPLDANGRLPPKIPVRTLEEVCQPFRRRRLVPHRLADVALLLTLLAFLFAIITPLAQERVQRSFAGPLQNLIYSTVKIVSPQKAKLIKPGIADPIVDVNDAFEYTRMHADQDAEARGLRAKFTLIGSELITQTLRVVKNGVFNTTQLLGTIFFGEGKRYFITSLADAFLRSLTLSDKATIPELEAGSIEAEEIQADVIDANLDWKNLTNRPSVVSSVDGVVNDGGNIDLVAGANITIVPNDAANTITFSSTGGGGGVGGDADTLDGLDSAQFLRSDTSDQFTSGTLALLAGTTLDVRGSISDTTGNLTLADTVDISGGLNVTGATTLSNGLTVSAGTASLTSITIGGDTINDFTGNGLQVSTNVLTLALQANKGLEVDANGLSLIDCGDTQILKYSTSTGQWSCQDDVTGGSPTWDTIGDPATSSTMAHGQFSTSLDWNMASDAALNALSFTLVNDLATDTTTQRLLVLSNLDDALGTGTTEALLYFNNADINEAVTSAIQIANTGGGGYTNFLDTASIDISGTGAITGATGVSTTTLNASSTATFTGNITANDASADTILIGQSGATDDTVTIAGNVSITDDDWAISVTGLGTNLTANDLSCTDCIGAAEIDESTISSTNLSDGANIAHINAAETISGGWTFNTAATTFTTAIDVNSASTIAGLTVDGGSLILSGLATDITTGTDETLVIVANGTGVVDIQDATTVDSLTTDVGGVLIAAGQSYTGAGAVTFSSGGGLGLTVDSASGIITFATGNDLIPTLGAGTADIGSSGTPWDNLYATNYYQGSTAIGIWLDGGAYIYPSNVGTSYRIADTTGDTTISGALDMTDNVISNIGDSDTDFTATGGLTLADTLTMLIGTLDVYNALAGTTLDILNSSDSYKAHLRVEGHLLTGEYAQIGDYLMLGTPADVKLSRGAADRLDLADGDSFRIIGGQLQMDLDDTGVTQGVVWGSTADTNLYRSAADTLKTDDKLVVGGDLVIEGQLSDLSDDDLTIADNLIVTGTAFIRPTADNWTNSRASMQLSRATDNYLVMTLPGTNTAGIAHTASDLYIVNENGDIRFRTGVTYDGDWSSTGTERLTILSGGNVGIGTPSPVAPLTVDVSYENDEWGAGTFINSYVGEVDTIGVYGKAVPQDFYGIGGYFEGGWIGVSGTVAATGSSDYYGVSGSASGGTGDSEKYGVEGSASGSGTNYGVYGYATGGTANWAGYFTSGNVHIQNNLGIGNTNPLGKLMIDGSADDEQFYIQAHSTQTSSVILVEQSGGTDILTLNNAGQLALPTQGSTGGLVIGGDTNLYRESADLLRTDDRFRASNLSFGDSYGISINPISADERVFVQGSGTGGVALNMTAGTGGVEFCNGNWRCGGLYKNSNLLIGFDGTTPTDTDPFNVYDKVVDTTNRVAYITASGDMTLSGNLTVSGSGNNTFTGNIIPSADDQYDLGSATARWQDLYLGPTSLNIYRTTGADAEYFTIGYDGTPTITFSSLKDGAGTARNFNFTGGNVGIGKTSPSSRLHVVGSSSVATVGTTNVLTADGTFDTSDDWTVGEGWIIASSVASHATGYTEALSGTSTATSTTTVYQVNFTVAVTTAGTGFTVSLGGRDSGNTFTTAGTKAIYIKPSNSTGTLSFTPGSAGTFVGTIDTVTIYALTASLADSLIESSNGTLTPLEIRAGGSNKYNTFIGDKAGAFNTTGAYNSAMGYQALYSNTTGEYNSAVGVWALFSNTTASYNTAVGRGALYANTTGTYNLAVGSAALQGNTTGSYNSAVGGGALLSTQAGNNNTALGYLAGYNNVAGSGNVFLGYNAGYYETGSDKLFIDNQQRASEADARIKALIYGVFDADPANQVLTINGRVGVGTTDPLNDIGGLYDYASSLRGLHLKHDAGVRLVIEGNSPAIDMYHTVAAENKKWLQFKNAAGKAEFWSLNDNGTVHADDIIVMDLDTGSVGIGTASPGAKLDVKGIIWANPAAGSHAGVNFRQAGVFKGFVGYNDTSGVVNLSMDGGIVAGINVDSSGNVGIGDSSPDGSLKLDVEGQVGATEYCDQSGANCSNPYYSWRQYAIGLSGYSNTLWYPVSFEASPDTQGWVHFFTISGHGASGGDPYNNNTLTGLARGGGWSDHLPIADVTFRQYQNEDTIYGIYRGTQGCMEPVVVYLRGGQNYTVYSSSQVTLRTTNWTCGDSVFQAGVGTPAGTNVASIMSIHDKGDGWHTNLGATIAGNLTVSSWAAATATHVCKNGDTLSTCSSAAEYVPTFGDIEEGDLISISPNQGNPYADPKRPFVAEKAAKPYDPNLIGFILNPELGADGEKVNDQYLPLGIYGYFPIKVSTVNGPIERGGPITSSKIPGVGMRATRAGFAVGRALEPYNNPDPTAVGKIQVFVNLSWYDPDVYLTDTGYLLISQSLLSPAPSSPTTDSSAVLETGDVQQKVVYELRRAEETITRIGAFSEVATAFLKAGRIDTQELTIAGQSLEEYILSKVSKDSNASEDSNPETLVDSEGDLAQVNADGSAEKIKTTRIDAEEGFFQRLTVMIEAIFEKITAKTAEIASAVIQSLQVEKAEIKTLEVEAIATGENTDSAGSGVIKKGEGKAVIKSLAATERSKIYVTFTTDYAPATRFWIGEKKVGESFTVELDAPVASDAKFDWWIIN